MHLRPRPHLPRALLPLLLAAGCDGCPSSKPYTPYTLGSAAPASSAPLLLQPARGQAEVDAGADAAVADAGAAFTPILGVAAPEDGKRWPLDNGAVVEAPTGRTFETGLVLDADGDGTRDLIAWTRAPDGLRGELRFAPGARPSAARTLAALPGDLSVQGCTPRVSLRQIGATTVAFDFAPQCPPRPRPEATRWIAIVRLPRSAADGADGPALAFELRIRTPPPDESLGADLDTADRDGDGRDDLTVSLALSGTLRALPPDAAKAPEMRAPLVFLDRPAGLSRDPSQPGQALRTLAAGLLRDARSKATAPGVAASAARLRRLSALLCADGGEAVVTTGAGPVRCGEPGLGASIAFAEAIAAQTRGAPLSAVAALDGGAEARGKDADKLLAKVAPRAVATAVHRAAAVPEARRDGRASIAFEPNSDLLILTASGTVRVDRASYAESPADLPGWPSAFTAGPAQLLSIERRCDAPTLIARVRVTLDADSEIDVPLPILRDQGPRKATKAAAPERCTAAERLPFAPLGYSEHGFELGVGATLLTIDMDSAAPKVSGASLPLTNPPFPGAFRSPDGNTVALPVAGALAVATAGGAVRLWSGDRIERATACVPDNGGGRVACVVDGVVAFYEAK